MYGSACYNELICVVQREVSIYLRIDVVCQMFGRSGVVSTDVGHSNDERSYKIMQVQIGHSVDMGDY
jgi:hypothetical protein